MISKETLTAIQPMIDQLSAAGRTVSPVEGSIVEAIVRAAKTPVGISTEPNDNWLNDWLQSLERTAVFGVSDNMVVKDDNGNSTTIIPVGQQEATTVESVEYLASIINAAFGRAMNLHKPFISDFYDRFSKVLAEEDIIVDPINIVDCYENPIGQLPIIDDIVETRGAAVRDTMSKNDLPYIPTPEPEVLSGLIKTNIERIDSALAKMLKELGMSAEDVFESLFGQSREPLALNIPMYYVERNKVLVKLLMASVLAINTPPKTGMSALEWETKISKIVGTLAYFTRRYREIAANDNESEILILNNTDPSGIIYVNGVAYDKWLDAGGTPELIYAVSINSGIVKSYTLKSMLEARDQLLEVWNEYKKVQIIRSKQDYLANLRRSLHIACEQTINETDLEKYSVGAVSTIRARAKEMSNSVTAAWASDLKNNVMRFVVMLFFPGLPTGRFLMRMDELLTADETMSVEDAGDIAKIEYLADWLAGNIILY